MTQETSESIENRANQQYAPIDEYLESLIELNLDLFSLATYLRAAHKAYKATPDDPALKAITVIRSIIEDKGGDPDELLKQLEQEQPSDHDVEPFLESLLGKTK